MSRVKVYSDDVLVWDSGAAVTPPGPTPLPPPPPPPPPPPAPSVAYDGVLYAPGGTPVRCTVAAGKYLFPAVSSTSLDIEVSGGSGEGHLTVRNPDGTVAGKMPWKFFGVSVGGGPATLDYRNAGKLIVEVVQQGDYTAEVTWDAYAGIETINHWRR